MDKANTVQYSIVRQVTKQSNVLGHRAGKYGARLRRGKGPRKAALFCAAFVGAIATTGPWTSRDRVLTPACF